MSDPSSRPSLLKTLTSSKAMMVAVPLVLVAGALIGIGRSVVVKAQAPKETIQAVAPVVTPVTPTIAVAPAATPPIVLAQAAGPSTFSDAQKTELHKIIKDYLLNNPEVFMEVQQQLESKMEKIQADKMAVALKENAAEIFRAPTAPVAGNLKGDVTVVEFFDYNCGYCKKAFVDVLAAAEKDKNIKLVLKELPILSKGSEETARVALAAKMQGKYWEFHRAMLESPGQANEQTSLKIAEKVGLNLAKLKVDMNGPEVKTEIARTRALAEKLGINGTPHFLIGERSVGGAPQGLNELIVQTAAEIRKSGGCKVC
jgi:protein-disulfide isomerase